MTKVKSTKRALLLSGLALLMCVSMLIGSTFAWFTDSVTSGSNVIQAGTLDIVMEYWDGDSWEDAEGQVLEFVKGGNYNGIVDEALWEPGCTYELPKIRVRNEGNLAAKVLLRLNGINGDEKLMEVIELKTKVTNIPQSILDGSAGSTFAQFNNASVDLFYGTPDGTIIFDWSLMGKDKVSPNTGHTDTSAEFTISGHMAEEAGNEYQGLAIEGISITALATQEVYEYDSFGREYDKNATFPEVIATAADLKAAIANGESVKLGTDIDLGTNGNIVVKNGVTATIDLNGHTLSATNTNTATHNFMIDVNNGTLNLTNGTVAYNHTGANMGWNGATTVIDVTNNGVLNLEGVTVQNLGGTDMNFAVHLNNWGTVTLNADNCVFDAPYCGVRVFNSGYDMNNVKITNSTLTGNTRAFWVHNYIGDLNSAQHSNDAINARLNLDIYNNNNTFSITGTATSPIRYGFDTTVFYDANGNVVA